MLGALALVAIAVVTYYFACTLLLRLGSRDRGVAASVALAALYAGPAGLCRVLHDLVLSTVAFGVIVLVATAALIRGVPMPRETVRPISLSTGRRSVGATLATVGGSSLVAWAALGGYWWDESNCHNGLVAVIARGIVPAVHPLFPDEPFVYHYGFDVLAAIVHVFTGAEVDVAIDITTMTCWFGLLAMATTVGRRLAGRIGANLAILVVPLGGGLLSVCFWNQAGPPGRCGLPIPSSWLALDVPPQVIANFFQHPQGLGMPLALAVLLLFADDNSGSGRRAVGGFVLGALSLAQFVFFSVLGLGLSLMVAFQFFQDRDRAAALSSTASLIGALGIAFGLGGVLESAPDLRPVLELGRPFFNAPAPAVVGLHLVHFGVPFLMVAVGAAVMHRRLTPLRVAVTTAAAISFAVPNFASYAHSWDIVKFYGVGAFFANVLVVDLCSPWIQRGGSRRILASSAVLLSILAGSAWLVRMGPLDGRFGVPKMHFPPPSRIAQATAQRLEPLMQRNDRVFSAHVDLGLSGGLLTPGFNWRQSGRGYILNRGMADRLLVHWQRARRTMRTEDLDALGVRFVVLSPDDIARLTDAGRRALDTPTRFERLFEIHSSDGIRHVFRVLPGLPLRHPPQR